MAAWIGWGRGRGRATASQRSNVSQAGSDSKLFAIFCQTVLQSVLLYFENLLKMFPPNDLFHCSWRGRGEMPGVLNLFGNLCSLKVLW